MNITLFFALNNLTHHSAVFDALVFFVAQYGDIVTCACAAVFLSYFFLRSESWLRSRHAAKYHPKHLLLVNRRIIALGIESSVIGFTVLSAWFAAFLLKIAFHAPRPFVTFASVKPLVVETSFTSFPSGHATFFFALATAIYLYDKRAGKGFFVAAVLIALSRVIAGVHYPVDILAGAVLGVGIAAISHRYISKLLSSIFLPKNK